jgi:hypothetical protein
MNAFLINGGCLAFAVISVLLQPAVAHAQETVAAAAATGKDVSAVAINGLRFKGKLVSLSATEVVLAQGSSDLRLPLAEIREVTRASHAVRNGALIGLGSGFGLGLALCVPDGCYGDADSAADPTVDVIIIAGMGAGAGALVGAIMKASSASSRTIYRASGKATINVAPAIGPTMAGVTGRITF